MLRRPGWLTALHPDPFGSTLEAVRCHLKRHDAALLLMRRYMLRRAWRGKQSGALSSTIALAEVFKWAAKRPAASCAMFWECARALPRSHTT